MIPLRDNNPSSRFPALNFLLIALCAGAFLLQLGGRDGEAIVERYGMIPARILHPGEPVVLRVPVQVRTWRGTMVAYEERLAAETPFHPWLTLLTCMFLHGGWLHVLGNLWFLHVFGDNVEDRLGHARYIAFYLASGVAASAAHILTDPTSTVPTIGASGAIAGVMGAYVVLFPRAAVYALVPLFPFFQVLVVPAWIFLGVWFLLQFLQGTMGDALSSGVAWWAHIGGFLVGILVGLWFRARGLARYRGWA
jgi:hypothetical protein